MTEFGFELKYKKGNINAQSNALSRVHTTGETVSHVGNADIPAFELHIVRVELKYNCNPKEIDFINNKFRAMDELYAAVNDPVPTNFNVEPTTSKK